jgi:type I restriction enzyme R subunit
MLENVHFDEARQSQLKFIELLLNMGYRYIPATETIRERGGDTSNFILADIAAKKLMEINDYEIDGVKYKFSEKEVRDCIEELEHIQYEGLIDTAQNIYSTIMPTAGGKTISINHGGKKMSKNFRFIDFVNPENNVFHVTAEFKVSGKQGIRPDIVCFVNGIPFVIVENKKSSVPIADAINQMIRNQGPEYCPKLFTYAQLLIATNGKDIRYGTTGTPNKFYAIWKEKGLTDEEIEDEVLDVIRKTIDTKTYHQVLADLNGDIRNIIQYTSRKVTEQDKGVVFLLKPRRLLDLTKNYILFDAGVKKLSRYQQYFAIRKMLHRIEEVEPGVQDQARRKGGLVWHTQGSGKSLTMVMFVKALIESSDIVNPRVIIVTDRRDLDRQIRDTFKNCSLKKEVIQATSGQHLIDLIKEKDLSVITTVIDKFESARKKYTNFVDTDQNIFVLVDEAHRSQNGLANLEMNRVIPNACYIGFTGTPLMTSEKESWRKFGGYIDKYTIDDALEDKIILPLIYEGRYVEMEQNAEQIDRRVELLPGYKHTKQLQNQITADIIKNNPQRIEEIARNIEEHFTKHFQNTGLKAQIVAPSKYSAILFQKFFEKNGKIQTSVVISDEHDDGDETDSHKKQVLEYLNGIRTKHSGVSKYEREVIESFKYHEDGMEIIIVVDKLLTGFDAPRNTVLYLAKDLRDHNLLQAIARVNRLHENQKLPKTAGFIIDYSENAKNIKTAMKLFGSYDEEDVKGTLIDVQEKIDELQANYGIIQDILKEASGSNDDEVYLQILSDEPKRQMFYKALNIFMRNMNECYVLQDFVHEFKQLDMYRRDLKKFMELRKTVSLKYAESVDLSEYKQSLINILDKYVDARGVELLTKQINITDRKLFDEAIETLGSDESKAEAIAAQVKRTITEKMDTDPQFYERFSSKVSELLQKLKNGKLADIEALKQMKLLRDDVLNKKDADLPADISKRKGSDIFYRNLREELNGTILDENTYIEVVLGLFSVLQKEMVVDWYKNNDVKRRMANALDDYFYDIVKSHKGIDISPNATKRTIDSILWLAENNVEIFS